MNSDTITRNLMDHAVSVRLCIDNGLILPALTLIYTGTDLAASLARPLGQPKVTRSDFIRWAETYMECRQRLGVEGIDLYGARCGIVHTYTPDSDLYREGKAKRIMYSWGDQEPQSATSLVRGLGYSEIFIKVEVLFEVFCIGLDKFAEAIATDKELEARVLSPAGQLFAHYRSFP